MFSNLKNLVFLKPVLAVRSNGQWSDEELGSARCIELGNLVFQFVEMRNWSNLARCGDCWLFDHVKLLPSNCRFSNVSSEINSAKAMVVLQLVLFTLLSSGAAVTLKSPARTHGLF